MSWTAIDRICQALATGDRDAATRIVRSEYPFSPPSRTERTYDEHVMMRVFLRDGFIDRYSGARLVFPGTLRLLSTLLPDELPYHPNWKLSETHRMYWELFPTVDHKDPVALGGADEEANLVSTSQIRNSAKAQWTLEELGWKLHDPGSLEDWDGLTGWFLAYAEAHPDVRRSAYLRRWWKAADRLRGAMTAG